MKSASCQACGAENPVANRFCGGCGGALARACPACEHVNPPDHRFCGACGASLGAPPESVQDRIEGSSRGVDDPEARKVVSVVFADLIGSTALHERLDAESVRRFMDRYYAAMRGAAVAHGGTVTQLLGDGVKVMFGVPRVAEDDAIRAVRAAVDMQRAFRELAREQLGAVGQTGLRIAVNSGEVVASDTSEIIGDPVNVAARLQEAARDGEVVPNAATRASERHRRALEARDWGALDALCAPALVFDDRRRLIRTTGDRDMLIASGRLLGAAGVRIEIGVLATAGDRLALEHLRWGRAGDDAPAFEMESLSLTEVDGEGRIVAVIGFDPDDHRGASAELRDRYARSDATWAPAAVFEALRAFNDHEVDRFRAALHDDFVFHDHRRTGLGALARADYIASVRPLFEEAPDICSETLRYIAMEKNGNLAIGRDFGTLRDGGEFESVYARIVRYRDDRIVALEQFELEHLDRARARFEELSRVT